MFAGARMEAHWGYWRRMPSTPVEYARIAANRQSETLIFRSDDNGDTWTEVTRFVGPLFMDAPHSMFEAKDGALMILAAGSPIPGGKGWPCEFPRWLMLLMRSEG